MSGEEDPCRVEELKTYERRKLVDGKEFSTTYAFEDDTETYVLEYFHKEQKAVVRMIKSKSTRVVKEDADWMKDDKEKVFYYDPYSNYVPLRRYGMQKIYGRYYKNEVIIDNVHMGAAGGSGRCTKAISYLIKVILLETAKLGAYPYVGGVYISTSKPCAAVNCYTHAFINNGFMPDNEELKDFKEDSKNIDPDGLGMYDDFDFEFKKFFSESQKEKYDQMSRKRTRSVTTELKL